MDDLERRAAGDQQNGRWSLYGCAEAGADEFVDGVVAADVFGTRQKGSGFVEQRRAVQASRLVEDRLPGAQEGRQGADLDAALARTSSSVGLTT